MIILCRILNHGIENGKNKFKKLFTTQIIYDIIHFACARFSGFGVNLNEVFTCRFPGCEANKLMR